MLGLDLDHLGLVGFGVVMDGGIIVKALTLLLDQGVGNGNGREQSLCVGMQRILKQFVRGSMLHTFLGQSGGDLQSSQTNQRFFELHV